MIDKVKQIDISVVAEDYITLERSGGNFRAAENPLREEKTSSLYFYTDTQRYFDFGSGEGGDIIDFIEKVEGLDKKGAIRFLQAKYLDGAIVKSQYKPITRKQVAPAKDNVALFQKLEAKARKYLAALHRKHGHKWNYLTLDIDGVVTEVVTVAPYLEKLFEGWIIPTDERFAKYLFEKVIGYCDYFKCPVIVIRDESERVVDIVRYRPQQRATGGKPLPKYLYTRNEEKPDSNYLFPLQAQMQKISLMQGYCFVGEGLKNALNASLLGVPFISTESASGVRPALVDFLKSDRMAGVPLIGAFDGDPAGEKAYKTMIEKGVKLTENLFSFTGKKDFAEWLKEEYRDVNKG